MSEFVIPWGKTLLMIAALLLVLLVIKAITGEELGAATLWGAVAITALKRTYEPRP